ncbi:MAG: transposase [Bacteroidetes bacterium]|nr:transposase [Bacteroidota bacterium]
MLFDYQKWKRRACPDTAKDFTGYLQSDGWNAYENFDKTM